MVEGNVFFGAVGSEDASGLGAKIEQGSKGGAGAAAGAQFHDLAEEDESGDSSGGFEVDVGIAGHIAGPSAQRLGKNPREECRDHAVCVGDAGAHTDQGEHVRAAVDERSPETLEEGPSGPEDDRGGENEFQPGKPPAPKKELVAVSRERVHPPDKQIRPEHAAHGDREQGDGERHADPEAPSHVAQLWIFFGSGGDGARLEGHAADRTRTGRGTDDLGMHGAGVLGARGGYWDIGLESHAAGGAGAGLRFANLGTHGANVGGRRAGGGAGAGVTLAVGRVSGFVS